MLLNIFLVLFILTACLVVVGFIFKKQWEYLAIAGSVLLMLLALLLISDPLEFRSGEYYVYGNYFDEYHWDGYNTTAPSQTDKLAFLFHEVTEYEPISTTLNNLLWFILLSSGLFLFIVKIVNIRSDRNDRFQSEEEDMSY